MNELDFLLKKLSEMLKNEGRSWARNFFFSAQEHSQVMHHLLTEFGPDSLKLTEDGWSTTVGTLERLRMRLEAQGGVMPVEPENLAATLETRLTATVRSSRDDKPPLALKHLVRHRLADPEVVLNAASASNGRDRAREAMLARLKNDPDRFLPKASKRHLCQLPALGRDFPNFAEVLAHVEEQLHLLILEREVVHFEPVLLVGLPGVGKTEFARCLATALQLTFSAEDLAACTSSFVLTGSSATWSTGAQGSVSRAVLNLKRGYGALFLLDELDKARGDAQRPVAPALLNLLEPGTAERFVDEYLGVPLNVQRVVTFVATANDLSTVDPPLKSRFRVFNVPMPDAQQMRAVVRSLDWSLRQQRPGLRRRFAPLPDESVEFMSALSPRTLRQVLLGAYAAAASRKERAVKRHHLVAAAQQRMESHKPAMGFVS